MSYVQEMVDTLGLRLAVKGRAQAPPDVFGLSARLSFLNEAQLEIVARLKIHHVREIETVASAQTLDSEGAFDLTTLTPKILEIERGIVDVKLHGGKHAKLLTDEDRRVDEDASVSYSESDPRFYFIGTDLHVVPYSGYTADITYKAVPTAMALGATLSNFTMAAAVTPSLTKFRGTAGQGLSAVDDTYKDKPIYCVGKNSYHVVTGYDATGNIDGALLFTVSPAAATNFGADLFSFPVAAAAPTADTECDFHSPKVRKLIVDLAASYAFRDWGENDLEMAISNLVDREVARLNNIYAPQSRESSELAILINRGQNFSRSN
jgi:hypothetical protein